MTDVEIRAPRRDEFTAVGDLTVAAYRDDGYLGVEPRYEADLRDVEGRAAHSELLVAVDGAGEVLGSVVIVHPDTELAEVSRTGELEFRMLAVASAARGRGIGEALTRAVVDRARELGRTRVVLSSQDGMKAAHRLYERIGFTRLPERDWRPLPHITLVAYGLAL
ncbi:GNAT family N-acetyltransferase [Amycolatopsis sp. NPDC059027]|uniref:GNAT family N-acetyltransferase n=1 Tax=unclassified Amycolatopsis TaxID=2618356 RepID=UPI003670A460